MAAPLVPTGGLCCLCLHWSREGNGACQQLSSFRGLPVISITPGHVPGWANHTPSCLPLVFFKLLGLHCIHMGCFSCYLLRAWTLVPNAFQALPESTDFLNSRFLVLLVLRTHGIQPLSLSKGNIIENHPPHSRTSQCEILFSTFFYTTGSHRTKDSHSLFCSLAASSPLLPSSV